MRASSRGPRRPARTAASSPWRDDGRELPTTLQFDKETTMALLPLLTDEQASARARAVFDDIRATRRTDYINNIWRALANDPTQLETTWGEVKRVMAPGALDPLTKELVYIAVSAANNCSYCLHTHTASARAKGMTAAMFSELMQVVYLASLTNRVAVGLQVEVDERYTQPPEP
jgi:AhpD family alkylhydroperoxidase